MAYKDSLKKKTLKAGIWLFIRKFLARLINLAAIYVLARKLSPSDFGIVALANVALRLVTSGVSQTTSTFVIYDNSEKWKEKVNTAFWINILLLFIIFIIMLFVLPFLVKFYKGGILLKHIISAFFIAFIFTELRTIPDAILKKQLLYDKLVLKDTIMDIFSAIFSIIMALSGFGVWSLVIPVIITSIINLPVAFILSKWFPSLPSLKGASEIMKYTIHVMGSNILTFLGNEGDTLIVGKMLGFRELGIYNRAYASANLIISNVKSVITEVSFPSLSAVNQDRLKLRNAFLKMIEVLSIVGFPLTIGLIVVAREFILILYGPKWVDAVIPMQILLIMALRRIVGSPIGTYFNATGKPQIMFRFALFFVPIYLLGVMFGATHGIIGVALSVTFMRTAGGMVTFYLLSRDMKYPLYKLFSHMVKPFVFSIIMGLVVYTVKTIFPVNNIYLALILYACTGVLTYSTLIFLNTGTRKIVMEIFRILK